MSLGVAVPAGDNKVVVMVKSFQCLQHCYHHDHVTVLGCIKAAVTLYSIFTVHSRAWGEGSAHIAALEWKGRSGAGRYTALLCKRSRQQQQH
jgi:hypothetical protein